MGGGGEGRGEGGEGRGVRVGGEEGGERERGEGGEWVGVGWSGIEWEWNRMEWDGVRGEREDTAHSQVLLVWEVAGQQEEEKIGKVGLHERGEQTIKAQVHHKQISHDACSRRHGQRTRQLPGRHGTLRTTLVSHTTAAEHPPT